MSVLTDPFPKSVTVNGTECPVAFDFRTILKCYEIQSGKTELSQGELLKILLLFYRKQKIFSEEHVEKMFWFFSCGREKETKRFPRKIAGVNDKQPFDFEKDAELIYAGFVQQYGIDLQTENMHWWKFMILLENLGSDTRLNRVIEYRTIDTSEPESFQTGTGILPGNAALLWLGCKGAAACQRTCEADRSGTDERGRCEQSVGVS